MSEKPAAAAPANDWETFCDALKEAGKVVLSYPEAANPLDRSEGYRYLTRLLRHGLNLAVEFGDPDFPVFFAPSDEVIKINSDNPDTQHFMAVVGPGREYRITGLRGTVNRIVFTCLGTADGNAGLQQLGALEGSELHVDPAGRVEISVSEREKPGDWLPMPAGTSTILIRAIFLDRQSERAPEFAIERTSPGPAGPVSLDATFGARLQGAAMTTVGVARRMAHVVREIRKAGHVNALGEDASLWGAGDPSCRYRQGVWSVAGDEALIVRFTPPPCFFWNFQVNNIFMESLDYRHHRIHLNKSSAHYGPGGSVTIVIAHADPGVPNWLATDGHGSGTMVSRWIDSPDTPEMHCTLVTSDQVQSVVRAAAS